MTQLSQLIGGYLNQNMVTDGTPRYFIPTNADASGTTTIANAEQIVAHPGEFSDFYVEINGTPGAGKSYTFTLMVDQVASTLTVTISGASATTGRDTVNTVRVTAGQSICFRYVGNGTPTAATILGYVMRFKPDVAKHTILLGGGGGYKLFNDTSTQYMVVSGWDFWSASNEQREIIPIRGTLKNLYIEVDVAPGVGNSWTIVVQKNNVDTALTVTISGVATTGNNTTNSVAVSPRDYIRLRGYPTPKLGPARAVPMWGCVFVPENDGESIHLCNMSEAPVAGTTQYGGLNSWSDIATTWRVRGFPIYKDFYVKNLFVDWGVATGAGQSVVFYLSREIQTGATTEEVTTLSVNIANAQTGSDTFHQVYMKYDVSICAVKHVPSAGVAVPNGTTTKVLWSVVLRQHLKSNLRLRVKGRKPYIRVKQRRMS